MTRNLYLWILEHSLLTVVLCALGAGGIAWGVKYLAYSNDYRMFFSADNPQLRAFEQFQNIYNKADNILFVLSPEEGDVFTPNTLDAIEWLTKQAWQTPYSIRVDSITNFQHTRAEGDDLHVGSLVRDALSQPAEVLQQARQVALEEPLLLKRLISPDGICTGVNVTLQLPGKDPMEIAQATAFARQLAGELRVRNPGLQVRLTGLVVMNNAFAEATEHDLRSLYPIMLVVILVFLGVLLRSIPGMLAAGLILGMTVVGTLGFAGWFGIKMSPPTAGVAVIVMTLAVADCVHLTASFLYNLRTGISKQKAMLDSLEVNQGAVFLTSLTTAVGFLSMNTSEAPPFRDLGNMAAMGVALAWLLAMTFLPALLMLLPVRYTKKHTVGHHGMELLAEGVIRHHRKLFWGVGGLTLVLLSGIPRNELNDDFVKYFSDAIEFRRDTDYAMQHLSGIIRMEYSVPAGMEGGISEPQYLAHLDQFAHWYRQQPKVMHVSVFTDVMKKLNKSMHGDDPAWYRLPEERELAAQYLLLYEMSLPFGLDLNNQINGKRSATRVTVVFSEMTSEEQLAMERQAQAWIQGNLPEYMWTEGTSPSLMFAHIGHRNIRSMLWGSLLATVIISLIMIFALRSWSLGLVGLLPNLVPIGMAFGIWGYAVGQMGLALSVVASITIGIVVDDTIHFLSKYQYAMRELKYDPYAAIRYSFGTVGTALWVTTLVLVAGFAVLMVSDFEMNAGMGMLSAFTIGIALFGDFLFLPPLLMLMRGRLHEDAAHHPTA